MRDLLIRSEVIASADTSFPTIFALDFGQVRDYFPKIPKNPKKPNEEALTLSL